MFVRGSIVEAFIPQQCPRPHLLFCCKESFPTLGRATGCRYQPNWFHSVQVLFDMLENRKKKKKDLPSGHET